MKSKVLKLTLVAIFSSFLTYGVSTAADNTAPDKAVPGTVQSTDSKTQTNDPAGPNHQSTASTSPDSKMDRNAATPTSDTVANQSKPDATKTPQKNQEPKDADQYTK